MKVIARSNEDDPFIVGTLIGKEKVGSTEIPIVKGDDGQTWFCMGIVVPYTDELAQRLGTMTPKEQWNDLSKNYKRK